VSRRIGPFGVVLIREGREVGDPATPYETGTLATIVRHETLPDGRMHIACVGGDRFTIAELHDDEPYITASIGPARRRRRWAERRRLSAPAEGRG